MSRMFQYVITTSLFSLCGELPTFVLENVSKILTLFKISNYLVKKTKEPQWIFGSLLGLPKVMAGHCCAFWKWQYLLLPEKMWLVLKVMM